MILERNLELDKQIAKIIYGSHIVFNDNEFSTPLMASSSEDFDMARGGYLGVEQKLYAGEPDIFCLEIPEYSINTQKAFWLIERLHEKFVFISLSYENDGAEWECWLNNAIGDTPATIDFKVMAETASLVICKAFLEYHRIKQ